MYQLLLFDKIASPTFIERPMPKHETADELMETVPESSLAGNMQVLRLRLTRARQEVGKILESQRHAQSVKEIAQALNLPRATVQRILKKAQSECLVHFSEYAKGYFRCRKPFRKNAESACHSFGVCCKCHRVSEFVHPKHQHPKIRGMRPSGKVHEWPTICFNCSL